MVAYELTCSRFMHQMGSTSSTLAIAWHVQCGQIGEDTWIRGMMHCILSVQSSAFAAGAQA